MILKNGLVVKRQVKCRGFLQIRIKASSVLKAESTISHCIRVLPLSCRLVIFHGFGYALFDTNAMLMEKADIELRGRVSPTGCQFIARCGQITILCYAAAKLQTLAKAE
jgi:hypothetical protein